MIIGPPRVGKSSLIRRFVFNSFSFEYVPTLEDYYKKSEYIDSVPYELHILDTSGAEDFDSLIGEWITDKDGVILAYSIENQENFKSLQKWINEIRSVNIKNPKTLFLVANKTDLKNRKVTEQEGRELAEKIGAFYFELSAKNDKEVHGMFGELVRVIMEKRKEQILAEKSQIARKINKMDPEKDLNSENDTPLTFSKCNLI